MNIDPKGVYMATDQRVMCPRHHWQFSVTVAGIEYKCRAGECRTVYTATWEELEAKRQQVMSGHVQSIYVVTPALLGDLHNG